MFRASHEHDELPWARRADGTLTSANEDVESRVSVEEKWGTRDHFDELDTLQVHPRYHGFRKECYLDRTATNKDAGERDGCWEGMRDNITREELEEANGKSNSGTAAGPLQVGIDAIQALS